MQYVGTGRLGRHQSVAYSGTLGTITNVISAGVTKIRLVTTTAAYFRIDSPAGITATPVTSSDIYRPADLVEYFTVTPGQNVTAVQVSGAGTLHVTEMV